MEFTKNYLNTHASPSHLAYTETSGLHMKSVIHLFGLLDIKSFGNTAVGIMIVGRVAPLI